MMEEEKNNVENSAEPIGDQVADLAVVRRSGT